MNYVLCCQSMQREMPWTMYLKNIGTARWELIILRINFHCITLHCICWANIHQLSVCVEARTNSLNSFWPYVGTIFLYTHNWIAIKHTNNNQPWSWPYQVSYLHTQQLTTSVSLSLCTIYSRWICAIAAAKIYIVFAKHKVIEYILLFIIYCLSLRIRFSITISNCLSSEHIIFIQLSIRR